MSRNVEIVKALQPSDVDLVAATKGDHDLFADLPASLFADDFESVFIAPNAPTRLGPFRGVEGFAAGWLDWLEPWKRYEIHTEEFIDAGDQVVVFARVTGHTHRDGVEVEHTPAAIWTLRDGIVRSIAFYLNREEALRVVGLE